MKTNLTIPNIKKFDKSNMLDLLLDFPLQCKIAQELARNAQILIPKQDFTKILFSGMGGSSIGADLVRSYLYFESKLPILVFREYDLPNFVDDKTLVFIISYSGNTEETISAYQQAKEKNASIIIISSGGILKEYALKEKITFIEIPKDLPPRASLGYLSIIPLCILARLGLIKEVDNLIKELIEDLTKLKEKINPKRGLKENPAKYIASKIFNKIVFIYSASVNFDVCAVRLRCQLNENAKCLASSHFFPEMNHNEIVGWQNPKKMFKNFIVLLLRDNLVHPRVNKRIEITKQIFKKEEIEIIELYSEGRNLLSRIFSLIYMGDFLSFYLAILYQIDPTPVERITYLKNELAKN